MTTYLPDVETRTYTVDTGSNAVLLEVTKRENGYDWSARWYLYVPDSNKPSTWKLRIGQLVNGKPQITRSQLGAAAAALGKGFRGQKVQLPGDAKKKAISKLRGLYRRLGVKNEDMPPHIREWREGETEDLLFEDMGAFLKTQIDRDSRTIHDVVLAGPISKNGRRYLTNALAEAVGLYENVRVFLNHPTEETLKNGARDVRDLAGYVTEARINEGKVKGTLHVLPSAMWLFDIAESKPDLLGMSHVARGVLRKEKKEMIVERILDVRSVDIVTNPATTKSLFENTVDQEEIEMTKEENIEAYPELLDEIREELSKELQDKEKEKGLEDKVKELQEENERLKMEAKAAETAKLVEERLSSSPIPDKTKERVRKAYEGKVATKEEIDGAVKEIEDIAEELKETPPTPVTPSTSVGDGTKTRTLAEQTIWRLFGMKKEEE